MGKSKSKLSLSLLTKSNVWALDENELYQLLMEGKHEVGYSENEARYMNIIRPVFDLQQLNRDDAKKVSALEAQHYQIFHSPNDGDNNAIAIRKRPIKRITDLTLENIRHLTAVEVLELIKNNMDTGWNGIPLHIQDIIESTFYVDNTTMPEKMMHRKGGIIDKRKDDGYDVLELLRGSWVEAIFLKAKPKYEKMHFESSGSSMLGLGDDEDLDEEDEDDDSDLPEEENDEEMDDMDDEDPEDGYEDILGDTTLDDLVRDEDSD